MTPQAIGLLVFAVVVALDAFGLGLDVVLRDAGLETVSGFARRNQWAAAVIVGANIFGLIGLAIHFSNGST
jgi:hypothetical protein